MRKSFISVIFTFITALIFAQNNVKIGDTLYYQNNKYSYYKTDTFIILEKSNVGNNVNHFFVKKFIYDSITKKNYLESKFTTDGLSDLRSHGIYTEYYRSGQKFLEGETVEGQRTPDDLWTYYYKNGEKKSEEKLYESSILSLKKVDYPLVMSFWDKNGVQKVIDGNGVYEFENENGAVIKGNLIDGLRVGDWIATKDEKVIYKETYRKGKFIRGESFDDKGKKYNYKKVNIPASFKTGGVGTVRQYVVSNFDENISGTSGNLVVWFNVDTKGAISNIRIIQPLTNSYNTEVERIIRTMKKGWKPAKLRGKPVDYTYKLSLNFK